MTTPLKNEQRRAFMRRSLKMIPVISLGGSVSLTANAAEPPTSLADYEPEFFSQDEWQFILAACDRLIPADEYGPGALETNVPIFIDRQMEEKFGHAADWYMQGPFYPDSPREFGYQASLTPRETYRQGIAAVNRYCQGTYGKPFDGLSAGQRDHILTRLDNGDAPFNGNITLVHFFNFLVQNTKEGFFADPIHGGNKHMAAWKMIGFPGARASFREWVEHTSEPYPLGPVSISGERG